MNSFYLAWRYLSFHRWRSLTVVACVTLIAFLPLGLQALLRRLRPLLDAPPALRRGQPAGAKHADCCED